MIEPPDTLVGVRRNFVSRLPMNCHLALRAGGKLIWPWRSAMFQHNKRRKRGPFKRTMRGLAKKRKCY